MIQLSRQNPPPRRAPDHWQSELVFDNADSYFDALLTDLEQAQHSIELETYIFNHDALGVSIIKALINANQRGVQVRVLIDGFGSRDSLEYLLHRLQPSDTQVRVYHPLPWYFRAHRWSLNRHSALGKIGYLLARLNQRDHRKLCVIDQESAWVGSFNISGVHLSTARGGSNWRDYGVRVSSASVSRLTHNFDNLWFQREPVPQAGFLKQYISNLSPLTRRLRQDFLVDLIDQCQQRLWITNAYFAPSPRILKALKQACKRGVDVQLIVAEKSDVVFFPTLTATYYGDLLRFGVGVFAYHQRVLHAKVMLVDDKAIIGSTNFNQRSFLHDLELDLVLNKQNSIEQLERCFHQDASQSIPIDKDRLKHYQTSRWFGWLPRLFRYWL